MAQCNEVEDSGKRIIGSRGVGSVMRTQCHIRPYNSDSVPRGSGGGEYAGDRRPSREHLRAQVLRERGNCVVFETLASAKIL